MVNDVDRGFDNLALLPEKGNVGYAYLISCVAAVGGLLFGFDTAIISGTIEFLKVQFDLSAIQKGHVAGSALIGCIVGAMIAGILSDKFGRKKVLIGTAVFYALSAWLSAVPQTLAYLIVARFIGGLAVGVSSMVSPIYIAEISPARIRGRLVALNQMAIVTGICIAYIVDWLLVDVGEPGCRWALFESLDQSFRDWFGFTGHTNWRWMFGSETLPAVVLFFGLLFVPESPRWLTKRGFPGRAMKTLSRIGGGVHAAEEMQEIQETLALEDQKHSIFQIFRPGLRFALLIGISLAILQQITGINIIIYYAPTIFLKAGFDDASSAFFKTVIVGTTNCVMTIIALAVIDKLGRKPLLMIGSGGMAISLIVVSLAFQPESISPKWIIIPICTYIAFFGVGLGATVWVLMSEIFPTDIRGRAMSIATVSLWVSCYLVTLTFPYFLEKFAVKTFFGYAMINVFMFFFVWVVVRETKGKTLEEIERSWKIKS
ncbi:MAG: sugar porter family MFS transporter [Planctomycetota bacterium]|jgi:MFS family permease